jgi:preprotein translocase subunit SecE
MSISKSEVIDIKEKDDKRKNRNVMTTKNGHDKNESKLHGFIKISSQFLKDCKTELKRVKWPTRKELIASTGMVLFLVILIAFVLGVVDYIIYALMGKIAG